jgi:hypothetical protein
MALVDIIQYVAGRTNIPKPSAVMANIADTQILQLVNLLEEEGNDLAKRGPWQAITFEATLTTTAAEDQGAMTTIAANGFRAIKNETFWDRSSHLQVLGPLTDDQWQGIKGTVSNGPRYYYRIRGGKLLINPVPAASLTFAFEYLSKNWILGADGTTYKQYFTLDTDTILLPEDLVLMGLRWRWKKEKGLEYSQDFDTYEKQVAQALGEDGGKPRLYMDHGVAKNATPGIIIPQFSWNL